jgi:RNA polymerase sigma factor (sigma-70 family)
MMPDQDKLLVNKILNGDLKAFHSLVELYQKLVFHIVFRLISNKVDQEEVCHEIFIKVYENLSGFKFDAKLSTWIGRIAYHTTLNFLRKEKLPLLGDLTAPAAGDGNSQEEPQDTVIYKSESPTPEEIVESLDRSLLIQKQLDLLPAPFRTILTLYHLDQMSYQEIGKIMDLPEGTVKSYLFRGRKKLKEVLVRELQGEEL